MRAEKKWYCFTFGTNHTHPIGGYSMASFWVEIFGTFDEARDVMFSRYGKKWSMQYEKKTFDQTFFPGGCHEKINTNEN